MKWIPVTERLPETSGKYLTTSSDYHKVGHGWYNTKYNPGWEDDKENNLPVTHWMPLPETPDESSTSVAEGFEDEIYEINDIDTVREMLIKAKKSSYQWCKKAMEAANHRIQLQQTIKELTPVTGEEVKDLIPDEIYKDIADFFKYSKYRGPYTIQKYGGSMIVKFMDGSKAKCSIQMWQGEEVVLDEPTTHVTGESEAIGFAEWISNNQFFMYDDVWESTKIHYSGVSYTTSELYNLYKQSKK